MPRKCAYQRTHTHTKSWKPKERKFVWRKERAEKCISFVMIFSRFVAAIVVVAVVIIICDLNIRLETCKCNTYAQRSHWETLRTESIDRYSWCQANAIRLRLHSLKIHTISCSITKITMRAMHQIFTHCASWVGKFAQFGFWSVAKTHFFSPSSTMPTIAHRRR